MKALLYIFNLRGPFSFQESLLRPKGTSEDGADIQPTGDKGRKAKTASGIICMFFHSCMLTFGLSVLHSGLVKYIYLMMCF